MSNYPLNNIGETYESFQEDDLDDDILGFQPGAEYTVDAAQNAQNEWLGFRADKKFREVIGSLRAERRWDETSGDPNLHPLESYKRQTLLNECDPNEMSYPTFIQALAWLTDQFSLIPKDVRTTMVRQVLEHRDKLSSSTKPADELYGQPILNLAVNSDNDNFIDCVLECRQEGLDDLVQLQDDKGKNCLHHIFMLPTQGWRQARDKTLERASKILPKASARTIAAKDKEGNTPLHYAMHYHQCWQREDAYVEMVKKMIIYGDEAMMTTDGPLNLRQESPIWYCMRIRRELIKKQEAKRGPNNPRQQNAHTGATIGVKTKNKDIDKGIPEDLKKKTVEAQKGAIPSDAPQGVGRRQASIAEQSGSGAVEYSSASPIVATPSARGQMLPPAIKPPAIESGPKPPPSSNGEVLPVKILIDFLRRHYLRTRSDLEARSLIHGTKASDINLCLDASEHKNAQDIIKLLGRMSHGGFNDTLSYVCLPTVQNAKDAASEPKAVSKNTPMNYGLPLHKPSAENPNIGRTALISVFDKLCDLKITSILRLQVEDQEAPSHTDEAIELALQGRDSLGLHTKDREPISVEVWDWRKPDLSADVIYFAAPDITEVNLYWTGNQAVLKAWSHPEGISKLKQLKIINLFAAPGLETCARMDRMLKRFVSDTKESIAKVRDTNNDKGEMDKTDRKDLKDVTGIAEREQVQIKINIKRRVRGLLSGLDAHRDTNDWTIGRVQGEQQHDWIKNMEGFRVAMRSVHEELSKMNFPEPERVKVALIDDGINLNGLDTYHARKLDASRTFVDTDVVKALGLTYCLPDGRLQSPWTSSSRGHGTIMANMILRINPWVFLYSMKLQDGEDNDGRRTIYADSAASAIRGAISREVTIMSMSWSVRNKVSTSISAPIGVTAGPGVPDGRGGVNGDPTGAAKLAVEVSPIKMLEDAVAEATTDKILMFCSATDDIQARSLDFLPYQKAPNYIFRIGAATAQGQRDVSTEDEKHIDYFFPGNQVAETWNPRSEGRVRYHDGSSVSTALAAGLASLIIYCAIVVRTYHEKETRDRDPRQYDQFQRFIKLLRNRENMKRAFDNIESDVMPDHKFLPVWTVFGKAAEKIKKAEDVKGKIEALEDLVMELCVKIQ